MITWNTPAVTKSSDEYAAVVVGGCLDDCPPGLPVTEWIAPEEMVVFPLPLISMDESPLVLLTLSFFFCAASHLLLLLSVAFPILFLPPLIPSPSYLCPSYSLSLSHHSQYGIHNGGACYVRSNGVPWTPSGDVEMKHSSSKAPLSTNLAATCDTKVCVWAMGRCSVALLNQIISSWKMASRDR